MPRMEIKINYWHIENKTNPLPLAGCACSCALSTFPCGIGDGSWEAFIMAEGSLLSRPQMAHNCPLAQHGCRNPSSTVRRIVTFCSGFHQLCSSSKHWLPCRPKHYLETFSCMEIKPTTIASPNNLYLLHCCVLNTVDSCTSPGSQTNSNSSNEDGAIP
jgi:hypothetical protein